MEKKNTRDEQERASGLSVALFSVLITVMALFICVLVTVMTVRAKPGVPGADPSVSGTDPDGSGSGTGGGQDAPVGPSVPVFSPSSLSVKPAKTANTKTVGASEIVSPYAVLVDAETGEILAGRDFDTRFDPASMTKIMTLLVACERLKESDLQQKVEITSELMTYVTAGGYKGASAHWSNDAKFYGDRVTVLDLLYGIGVESAADCSMMVVCYLTGKAPAEAEAEFVGWMNQEVSDMGLTNTHFDNAIGYESENNYSTASDIAAILIRALDCPLISDILSTKSREFLAYYDKNGQENSYPNHSYSTLFNVRNSSDGRIGAYESQYGKFKLSTVELKGGKTGSLEFERVWNYSLASFAVSKSGGKTYVLVTGNAVGGANVMKDAKTMYDTYAK